MNLKKLHFMRAHGMWRCSGFGLLCWGNTWKMAYEKWCWATELNNLYGTHR